MRKKATETSPCPRCHGSGEIGSEIVHGHGWTIAATRKTEKCPTCGGTGTVPTAKLKTHQEANAQS